MNYQAELNSIKTLKIRAHAEPSGHRHKPDSAQWMRIVLIVVAVFALFERGWSEGPAIDPRAHRYNGGIVRGDTAKASLALIFTAGDYGDGGYSILETLERKKVKASFFLTGDFYRNAENRNLITQLVQAGHYLGPHSDKHLLYCSWENRDSLLVEKLTFQKDLLDNYKRMTPFGLDRDTSPLFVPPFEWYNKTISRWAGELGCQIINFTPGTGSNADYTTPDMKTYRSSEEILSSIRHYENNHPAGLNGFLLLLHLGTAPERTDKLYTHLGKLIDWLHLSGYDLKRVDELLIKSR